MSKLALNGGKPIRKKTYPKWPQFGQKEIDLINEVINSGTWSYNGPKEEEFSNKFASYIGTNYAMCAANGTVTLQIILEALDIGYDDEVIVPGLTWQATAACCIDVNAIPILVDVEEDSWCIDPAKIEEAITKKTKAVIIVHLYGSNPRMDKITDICRKNNIFLIEDAAHQHGTVINGKKVGSFGIAGSFSFQESKILTSGEGGGITTNEKRLMQKMDALRNCGRKRNSFSNKTKSLSTGYYKEEGNFIQSGNYRITEFQAAILLAQLNVLDYQVMVRDKNAQYLNHSLKDFEGIKIMRREKETDIQSYFNFALRYDKRFFNNLDVIVFRKALSSELGCEVGGCYEPLNDCQLYRPLTKKRYEISNQHLNKLNPSRFKLPVCENAYLNESITLHHSVLLSEKEDMDDIVNAIIKIKDNVGEIR